MRIVNLIFHIIKLDYSALWNLIFHLIKLDYSALWNMELVFFIA